MKFIFIFLITVVCLFAIPFEQNIPKINLTEQEKKFLEENRSISLGVDATWAPYVFVKNNEISGGYNVELFDKINKIANTNIKVVVGVWEELVSKAKEGTIHGLGTSVYSKKRAESFFFTNPTLLIRNNIVVKEGNPKNIHSLSDLENKVVALQKDNGFQISRVEGIHGIQLVEFQDYHDLPQFLEKHNVDAIPMSDASLYTLNSLNIPFREVLYLEDDKEREIVCSINKKYPELVSIINKALKAIPQSQMQELRKKWLFSPMIFNTQAQKINLDQNELEFLRKNPRIVLGGDKSYVFNFDTNIAGDTSGYAIDIVNDIYELSGLRIDFKLGDEKDFLQELSEDKIDGFIAKEEFCKGHSSFICSEVYGKDQNISYRYAMNKESKEAISIINKSLKIITSKKSKLYQDLTFLTQEEKNYLDQKRSIRFCADPNWAPFEEIKEGKYQGIGADLLSIISSSIKIPFELVETQTWTESLEYIQKRKCDIIPLLMETKSRLEYMDFTKAILSYPLVVVTKNNVSFIEKIDELKGREIGIPKDYATIELLKRKYPYLKIIKVKSDEDGMERVARGELFAFIGTVPSIGNLIQKRFLGELKITGSIDEKWLLSIGTIKGDTTLLQIMEKSVERLSMEEKQKILNKWVTFVYEDNLEYIKTLRIAFLILAFLFIILIFFIYRQNLLKKYNRSLEKAVKEEREKNKLQAGKLIQQSKFAQMGEMTNIIAHQWRQPLAAISATSNNLIFKLILEEKVDKQLLLDEVELIGSYSQHLSRTINDFRSFFHSDKESSVLDINQVIEEVLVIVHPTLKVKNILVETEFEDDVIVKTYKNELKHVFLSIIQNAEDAIMHKNIRYGKIKIRTCLKEKQVTVEIEDNAGGVPKNIMKQIFEPYFTTKIKKGGTGIGLYVCKMIIESHAQGKLEIQNAQEGAVFSLTFPRY